MMGYRDTPSALLLLVLLTWAASADPSVTPDTRHVIPTETARSRDEERTPGRAAKADDLFDDVDPETLAALLLAALNRTREQSRREEDHPAEGEERDRDGRLKLELLMAAQGREERRKAEEEEERMTERVSSRTTSQTVPVQTQAPPEQGGAEEEQLNPEELKSLENVMKEFPRLDTAVKRGGDSGPNQRESRGYGSYNDIIPFNKGNNVATSEKKLKWQEETQKAFNVPSFRGNVMDDLPLPEDDEEEEEEEVLSPEEEEARAKAEQEEMRRQAAEAQRAKLEEEKLADIASDMLLRYMVKQNGGGKYASPSPNAAEDKRSEEDRDRDDIDPQTIDKLIEISSKLHLPADDVVDIISDAEKKKKKKKDVTPLMPASPAGSSPGSEDAPVGFAVSKQPSPALHLLQSWFQEQSPTRSKEFWSSPVSNPYVWAKALKPKKQNPWGLARYPYTRPSFYPVYFPPRRPTYRYYVPEHSVTLNAFLQRSRDGAYAFQPKQRYLNWVQPRLRKPPAALQRKPYYPRYRFPSYPQRPLAAPRVPLPQEQFYQSPPKGYLSNSKGHLEKYIERLLMKRPRVQD
ncbi:neurosecretory protein VGF-like [Phyllopteryx taeniolatus]|uniref:neurosecretory protein VGF-like n=1 Tax=Phyllopteryx taeniolatus TaxID=161469 RepID=UPI002AD44B75|nr:neurosecretory protein VGF-like [Phyllopteryx taeniolatus]XP_061620200.1 neurosecretory protein VGF-like [Phyllopteryx taeniolatus]